MRLGARLRLQVGECVHVLPADANGKLGERAYTPVSAMALEGGFELLVRR